MTADAPAIDSRYILDLPEEEAVNLSPAAIAKIRETKPVAYIPCMSVWLITKADDVISTMRNQALFRIFIPECTTLPILGPIYIQGEINQDQYTRIRKGSDAALNPKAMQSVVPNIMVPCIDAQLDRIADLKTFDLLDDVFGPMNFDAMKRILGVPHIDNGTMKRWYEGIHESLENLVADPARIERARQLGLEIDEVFRPIVLEKEANPDGSLIAHMLATAEGQTSEERRAFIMGHIKTLLLAGVQEGAHASVNTFIGLHTSPGDLAKFKTDPKKYVDLAVEESVRWLPPVAATHRRTTQPVEISGVSIPAQADLLISMASASRDPSKWGADADAFVLERFARDRSEREAQLGFGHLPRFCQGAPFIRKFVHEGMVRLFQRFPTIRPDPAYDWVPAGGLMSNYCHLRCVVD
jgi:cytochrome P450